MLYTTDQMAAIFSRESHVRSILRFEAALATAQADTGVITLDTASTIAKACETALLDLDQLYRDAIPAGTLAIPVVKMLTRHAGEDAGPYVHWGATSQDAIDTATMLQIRGALAVIDQRVVVLATHCQDLAEHHRRTLMIGRTLQQQAIPITFGLKAARWMALLCRQLRNLRHIRDRTLAIQFGGAVGTLASLGQDGVRVQQRLAEELQLAVPDLPWHTERDRIVEIASAIGLTAGCVQKIAGDLALMAQTEIGEISEQSGEGKGGSSTMPHKRNPV
ncbi:MAG: lyase family protein, partial [Thermomicrobiaceae bacterium]